MREELFQKVVFKQGDQFILVWLVLSYKWSSLVVQRVKICLQCRRPGFDPWVRKGNGNPLWYSRLENPMDRGAWRATVQGSQRVRHDWATSLPLFHFSCKHCKSHVMGKGQIRTVGHLETKPCIPYHSSQFPKQRNTQSPINPDSRCQLLETELCSLAPTTCSEKGAWGFQSSLCFSVTHSSTSL